MTNKWRIHVRDGANDWVDDDWAPNEQEARQQAAGWTGQRGQMKWTAVIFDHNGTRFAVYTRGKEVTK